MGSRWSLLAGLVAGAALSCTEHDPELGHVGGDALPGTGGVGGLDGSAGSAGAAAAAGSAGQSGSAGDGAAGCAPVDPSIVDPDFPCDVKAILTSVCQRCHSSPTQNSAPFSLMTWQDTQGTYLGSPIYDRMHNAVKTDFMPLTTLALEPPVLPLTPEQKKTLLDWLEQCAPPVEATTCP